MYHQQKTTNPQNKKRWTYTHNNTKKPTNYKLFERRKKRRQRRTRRRKRKWEIKIIILYKNKKFFSDVVFIFLFYRLCQQTEALLLLYLYTILEFNLYTPVSGPPFFSLSFILLWCCCFFVVLLLWWWYECTSIYIVYNILYIIIK